MIPNNKSKVTYDFAEYTAKYLDKSIKMEYN